MPKNLIRFVIKWSTVDVGPPPNPTTVEIATRPPETIVTPRPNIAVVTTPKIEFGPKREKKPYYQEQQQVYQAPKQDLVRPPRDVGVKLQKQHQQLTGKWVVCKIYFLCLNTLSQLHSKAQASRFTVYHNSRDQQVFNNSHK